MNVEHNTLFGTVQLETRRCIMCGEDKPLNEMELERPTTNSYRNACKSCRKKDGKIRRNLRKEFGYLKPHITDRCQLCNETGEDMNSLISDKKKKQGIWILDHNHETEKFRGWICGPCNTVIGILERKNISVKNYYKNIENYLK
jgi:hypothetical protein